jgi:signal transduction histidine kinase
MRTLSARILLGFAALTIMFGAITVAVVLNMEQVEDEIHVIGYGYMPLALITKDLALRQDDLRQYLDQGFLAETVPRTAGANLQRLRTARGNALKATLDILDHLSGVPDRHRREMTEKRTRLETLEAEVDATNADYATLIAAPPVGPHLDDVIVAKPGAGGETLRRVAAVELRVWNMTKELSGTLAVRSTETLHGLEQGEHVLGQRTVYFSIGAIAAGLFVMVWVVIMLRPLRRLRDAARRVASGDYGSSIPVSGPSEVADLAREFNSMGRAVEERERELVRSERLAAVGMMAAMITHEVRNPLSSIGLNTELLEDELGALPRGDEARALCRAITHEVDRLTAITEEYLAFARLPKPKLAVEAVNPMVLALATFVREDLGKRGVKLVVDPGPDDPVALVDAAQLRQCLVNLVRNAADAVSANGGGTVTIRTKRVGDVVAIAVVDDGVGIPADVLPRLFDPFFSTKEGGNGLGLALTRQIVKDHGGELRVESTPGRGATFTVTVPVPPRAAAGPSVSGRTSVDAGVALAEPPEDHHAVTDGT